MVRYVYEVDQFNSMYFLAFKKLIFMKFATAVTIERMKNISHYSLGWI